MNPPVFEKVMSVFGVPRSAIEDATKVDKSPDLARWLVVAKAVMGG